mgnify:CR=1 FL=1
MNGQPTENFFFSKISIQKCHKQRICCCKKKLSFKIITENNARKNTGQQQNGQTNIIIMIIIIKHRSVMIILGSSLNPFSQFFSQFWVCVCVCLMEQKSICILYYKDSKEFFSSFLLLS